MRGKEGMLCKGGRVCCDGEGGRAVRGSQGVLCGGGRVAVGRGRVCCAGGVRVCCGDG